MEPSDHQSNFFLAWMNLLALVHIVGFSCANAYRAFSGPSAASRRHFAGRFIALGTVVLAGQALVRAGLVGLDSAAIGVIGTCWYMYFFVKPPALNEAQQLPSQPDRVE